MWIKKNLMTFVGLTLAALLVAAVMIGETALCEHLLKLVHMPDMP